MEPTISRREEGEEKYWPRSELAQVGLVQLLLIIIWKLFIEDPLLLFNIALVCCEVYVMYFDIY